MASIEYRLTPSVTFPSNVEDVKTAVRWLRANAAPHRPESGSHLPLGHIGGRTSRRGRGTRAARNVRRRRQPRSVQCRAMCARRVRSSRLRRDGRADGRGESRAAAAAPALLAAPPMGGGVVIECPHEVKARSAAARVEPARRRSRRRRGGPTPHDAPTSPESRLIGAPVQTVPDRVRAASPLTYVSGARRRFSSCTGWRTTPFPMARACCSTRRSRARARRDAPADRWPAAHVLQPHESRRAGGPVPHGRAEGPPGSPNRPASIDRVCSMSRARSFSSIFRPGCRRGECGRTALPGTSWPRRTAPLNPRCSALLRSR